jgi:hypothetical protein
MSRVGWLKSGSASSAASPLPSKRAGSSTSVPAAPTTLSTKAATVSNLYPLTHRPDGAQFKDDEKRRVSEYKVRPLILPELPRASLADLCTH